VWRVRSTSLAANTSFVDGATMAAAPRDGGRICAMSMSPENAFNQAIYGPDAHLVAVTAVSGAKLGRAARLQATLKRAVARSWGK
jgi:hypothetical protein